jgi:hypothetical protein
MPVPLFSHKFFLNVVQKYGLKYTKKTVPYFGIDEIYEVMGGAYDLHIWLAYTQGFATSPRNSLYAKTMSVHHYQKEFFLKKTWNICKYDKYEARRR